MKRFSVPFLVGAIAGLVCCPVVAGHIPYIGLYADDGHSDCDWEGPAFSTPTFWVWVLPGDDGIYCAEFEIIVPLNVINAFTETNPAAGYHIGDALVAPGTTLCFSVCQTDWVWTHRLLCLVTDAIPSLILIGEATEIIFAAITASLGVWLVSAALAGYFVDRLSLTKRGLFIVAGLMALVPAGAFDGAIVTDAIGVAMGIALIVSEMIRSRTAAATQETPP